MSNSIIKKNNVNKSIDSFGYVLDSLDGVTPKIARANSLSKELQSHKDIVIHKVEESVNLALKVASLSDGVKKSVQEIDGLSSDLAKAAQNLSKTSSDLDDNTNKFKV